MEQAHRQFLARAESIDQSIVLHDQLIAFGQVAPESVPKMGLQLHRLIRDGGQAVLQPVLNGSVLLLTAALEQFVTDIIVAFSDNLPNVVPKYEDLPERIRSYNERMTGQAIGDNRFRNRFEVYQLTRFVENLRNCQAGQIPYSLNGEALALHSSNLNPQMLSELTGRLGVEGIWDLMSSIEVLKVWSELENTQNVRTRARSQLEELIETRNHIAHRVGFANPGRDIVRSFAEFAKALAQSLVEVLTNHANSLASAHNPSP